MGCADFYRQIFTPPECVTLLIGTGTHRGSTKEELRKMLGSAAERFTFVNHDCQGAGKLVFVGNSSCGGEFWLNKRWIEADLRLTIASTSGRFKLSCSVWRRRESSSNRSYPPQAV
jgi:nickel-dependent lactate racemase